MRVFEPMFLLCRFGSAENPISLSLNLFDDEHVIGICLQTDEQMTQGFQRRGHADELSDELGIFSNREVPRLSSDVLRRDITFSRPSRFEPLFQILDSKNLRVRVRRFRQ